MNETLGITPKPQETVLPESSPELLTQLHDALKSGDNATIEGLTAKNPRDLFCWATLASLKNPTITQYAYARIGYHRGLDTLRASGWRGSGYVKASEPSNRGFLCALALLHHHAGVIGETDEFDRCKEFLMQLDPSINWDDFAYDNPIDFIFNQN